MTAVWRSHTSVISHIAFVCGRPKEDPLKLFFLSFFFFSTKGIRQLGNINFRSVQWKDLFKGPVTCSPIVNCMVLAMSFVPFSLCISHWFERGGHHPQSGPSQSNFMDASALQMGSLINFMSVATWLPLVSDEGF